MGTSVYILKALIALYRQCESFLWCDLYVEWRRSRYSNCTRNTASAPPGQGATSLARTPSDSHLQPCHSKYRPSGHSQYICRLWAYGRHEPCHGDAYKGADQGARFALYFLKHVWFTRNGRFAVIAPMIPYRISELQYLLLQMTC